MANRAMEKLGDSIWRPYKDLTVDELLELYELPSLEQYRRDRREREEKAKFGSLVQGSESKRGTESKASKDANASKESGGNSL
jgi:hypothetical protein